MKNNYFSPILKAILSVMNDVMGQKVERGEALVKQNRLAFGEISCLIRFEGLSGKGTIATSFPYEVLTQLVDAKLTPDQVLEKKMVQNLVIDISTCLAEATRAYMAEDGFQFEIFAPEILMGKPHNIKHLIKNPTVFIPFTAEGGAFFVEVCFSKIKQTVLRSKLSYAGPSSLTNSIQREKKAANTKK